MMGIMTVPAASETLDLLRLLASPAERDQAIALLGQITELQSFESRRAEADKLDAALQERNAAIIARETTVLERIAAADARDSELQQRATAFAAREADLDARDATLKEREDEVAAAATEATQAEARRRVKATAAIDKLRDAVAPE